ncbi:Uu.00g097100.m01.CDS01 [Anthostomella pinea]|uniref:Uu.00g097100.m01.CDS01 n=1 Tax=Anthostomella pinea TaxID=933095 RepID=A0AAI8VDC1_9PEZI|nr:Uu.00g097100.m01.CDS01 [Anthostomella pinea]
MARKADDCLPISTTSQRGSSPSKFRLKALLSHCLYRRVVIWTIVVIVLLTVSLFNPQLVPSHKVLDLVHGSMGEAKSIPKGDANQAQHTETGETNGQEKLQTPEDVEEYARGSDQQQLETPEDVEDYVGEITEGIIDMSGYGNEEEEEAKEEEEANGPHWLRYKHLDGFYNGLRALVPFSDYKPEYPKTSPASDRSEPPPVHHTKLPKPSAFSAHPDYNSDHWQKTHVRVNPCYVDADKKISPPDLYAYEGIPQGQPKPVIGSHALLGLREDVCFDRFGRYGPYGLGYDLEHGGVNEAMETEREGSEAVWGKSGRINWDDIDWASAQDKCFKSNRERFFTGDKKQDAELATTGRKKVDRIAVVIRTYVGFKWTAHAVLNFRAMISELNLRSGGEYDVHFLLHVRDNNAPIWADPATVQDILEENVPPEFHGLCTLWSEAQMALYYPGNFGDTFENPSNGDIHGVYRSAHMPLQHFAVTHPQYAHFWNWEMDMRWTGSYYELFDRLGKWAEKQSRQGMWERAAKYYIPELHGSWEDFTALVEQETREAKKKPILGPVTFSGKASLEHGEDFMPPSCATGSDMSQCGVGEAADLITLNPLFDADESGWVFAGDVTGYDTFISKPPRRCAIVTASRLSRRLLTVMHEETWRLHHSMFSEMFPPSMAFHRGLKAVYAPHPVFLDRAWPQEEIEKAFNGGRHHSSGGHGSPFDLTNEHNHKGTTWYYNSEFAGLLWRRWLGYAQLDGRGKDGGHANGGSLRGGPEEEEDPNSTGRLCLRSMLVHPIKWENPAEQEDD